MKSYLEIPSIPLYVRLGCSKEEQAQPQKVVISLKFNTANYSAALSSDSIDDAICYVKASEIAESVCLEKPYHLIEHMAFEIYQNLQKVFSCPLLVKVHKIQPPHRLLEGGSLFTYGDMDL